MGKKKKGATSKTVREFVRAKRFEELRPLLEDISLLDANDSAIAEAYVLVPFSEDISLVRAFVDKGVPVDTSFKELGILHVAVGLPHPEFVRELIALGPNVNLLNSDLATPLIFCTCRVGGCEGEKECLLPLYQEIVCLLIDAGAEVNHADRTECTALDYACKAQNLELVKLLLSRGAEISRCSNDGYDAFWHALQSRGSQILSQLLKHGKIPSRDVGVSGESTFVGFAAQQGWLDKVKMLVEAGASATMSDGTDALKYAAEYHQLREKALREMGLL